MALWKFALIDYTQGAPITTPINEPVNWDKINLHLKRDAQLRGFFSYEDDSFSSLQYDTEGADILRNAYYNFGVDAKVELSITYICSETSPADNLYIGTFDFSTFNEVIADRCYIECSTVVSQSLLLYKKRADQQVDLDSLASFDQLPTVQLLNGITAEFQSGTNIIRLGTLLNGLLPGSKIEINGAVNPANNGIFSIASAKPDYNNVNPDLAGGNTPTSIIGSVTFNSVNNTISVNQACSIPVGQTITAICATFPAIVGQVYDNTGTYEILAVQQFFGYTIFTVKILNITNAAALNSSALAPPNGYMVSSSQDTVVLNANFTTTAKPIATLVQVPLQPISLINEEPAIYIGSITGAILTVTSIISGVVALNSALIGTGIKQSTVITSFGTGTGGIGTYNLNFSQNVSSETITGGISLIGYWLINNLKPYTGLGQIITIPSKEIQAETLYETSEDLIFTISDPVAGSCVGFAITPSMSAVVSDIDDTFIGTGSPTLDHCGTDIYNTNSSSPKQQQPDTLVFFRQGSLACSGLATIQFKIFYQWLPYSPLDDQDYEVTPCNVVFLTGTDPTNLASATTLASISVAEVTFPMTGKAVISGTIPNVEFPPGTYLWMFFRGEVQTGILNFIPKLLIGSQSYVQINIDSQCTETPCAVYMVNESLSRCIESYTNGEMVVYSDYFGRLNAQPEPSIADGCGSLECITNGVRVRGCFMPDGSQIPKFFTNFREMIEALDAIHNIGVGYEIDPNRAGKYRLRVEPFEWFFQNTVMLTCNLIFKYERAIQQNMLPSTFSVGYQQFETWNNNGLYDIFGKREYRTPLNQLQNDYQKVCKWMASDYAIEFMRREWGLTTSDGRYDSSTFILCLEDRYKSAVEFVFSCIFMQNSMDAPANIPVFRVGDLITVSGAVNSANNVQVRVSRVVLANVSPNGANPGIPNTGLSYVFCVDKTTGAAYEFTNEFTPVVLIVNNGTGIQFHNFPAYFIGTNGGVILDELELFNAQPNDSLVITSSVLNQTIVIQEIFSPQNAQDEGNLIEVEFPMIIFPTTHLNFFTQYGLDLTCIINDLVNKFYAVEQGMANGTNILSPDTVMNYRISPAHNAMRHFRNVIADRNFSKQILYFTGGDGNFYALGTLSDDCTPENGNISEGGNLDHTNFTVLADSEPLYYAEIIKFEYPLTFSAFISIQNNPYGLINFARNGALEQGWLIDLQYNPYTGLGQFQLYPKIK